MPMFIRSRNSIPVVLLALTILLFSNPGFSLEETEFQKQMKELDEYFTVNGKPVTPLAIRELLAWISDTLPGPIAVDILGTLDSNRYFGECSREKDGRVFISLKENGTDAGTFSYRHLGRLANGVHVLRTTENGGGTLVSEDLLLVRVSRDREIALDGTPRARLVLLRVGQIALGDRYRGEVTVNREANSLHIDADKRNEVREKTIHVD